MSDEYDSGKRKARLLSLEARAIVAAFVHMPCDEHELVFASDRAWEELRQQFPETEIVNALAECPDFEIEEA